MKNLLTFTFLAALLVACTNSEPVSVLPDKEDIGVSDNSEAVEAQRAQTVEDVNTIADIVTGLGSLFK